MALPATIADEIVKAVADELELDLLWWEFAKSTLRIERRLKPSIRKVFRAQKDEVLRRIDTYPPSKSLVKVVEEDTYNWYFKPEEWSYKIENAIKPSEVESIEEGYGKRITDINRDLGLEIGVDFDITNPRIAPLFESKLHKFSFEVNKTTLGLLKREFDEAIRDGDSIPNIQKRVEKVFGFTEGYRTERIARTEIIGTYNFGNYQAMLESGVVATHRWLATRDTRTRDSHRAIDGQIVKLGERFSNGLLYPGDWDGPAEEVINCRCSDIVNDYIE